MLVLYPAGSGAQTNMLPWLSGTFQPDAAQTAAQGVAAALVLAALALYAVQRAGQGSDGDLLNGQEHTEIDLAAKLF